VGVQLVRGIPLICGTMLLVRITTILLHIPIQPLWRGDLTRAEILHSLQSSPGEHLILVHYDPSHVLDREWVYNDADIDQAKVVWARDMGERDNQELLRYFRNRKVWRVDPDELPTRLDPVSPSSSGEDSGRSGK
jgi:hypothetical protein